MSIKKIGLRGLAALAVTTLVAGVAIQPAYAASDRDTFTFLYGTVEAGLDPYKSLAQAFEAANPRYKVNLQTVSGTAYGTTLRTQLQAGTAPDVFYTTPGRGNPHGIVELAEAGFLADISSTRAATTIPKSAELNFKLGSKIYGQGVDYVVTGPVVNDALMKEDGVEWPETFAQLLTACATAKAKGRSFFVIAGSALPNNGLFGLTLAGSTVYGPTPKWNALRDAKSTTFSTTPGWKTALDKVTKMQDAGCFQKGVEGGTFGTITVAMTGGTAAYAGFVPSGAAVGWQAANPKGKYVVRAFPGDKASSTIVSASVNNSLSVNANTKKLSAAKAFLRFAAQASSLELISKASGNIQLNGDFTKLPAVYAGVASYLTAKKTYALPNQGWGSSAVYAAMGTGIQGLYTGQTTTEKILASMDSKW
jgi:raffinose/stachyose/melibiose transport system substrate-binding protein